MRDRSIFALLAVLAAAAAPATAMARPGGWDGPSWGDSRWDRPGWQDNRSSARRLESRRSDEGRVQVARFVAEGDAAQALGHGAIAVASGTEGQDYVPQGNRAAYEAAVADQLVHAGYETAKASQTDGQLAELTVTRTVIQPAEAKRNPVSGEAAVSVGNRGTAYGLAVNVDFTKPLPPLVSTRLEARIRDRATNTVLWEGRAEVASREGADGWGEQEIAARLAEALFDGFPRASDSPRLGG